MGASHPSSEAQTIAGLLTRPTPRAVEAIDARLLAAADGHGVTALLGEALSAAGLMATLSDPARVHLARVTREAAVIDAVTHAHACRVCSALGDADVDALVFKGAALSHTHYRAPWLRPRGDVDLLVPLDQAATAAAVLEAHGCRRVPSPEGEWVTHQSRYVGHAASCEVAYDLHWRLADPHAFAVAFDHASLLASAVPGPFPRVRMAGPVDALLIACVHRAAHHFDTDRLLLVCDIDRIARRLSEEEWARFALRAETSRVCAVCLRGLDLAATLLETPVLPAVRTALAFAGPDEPTARYVSGSMTRKVDVLWSDLSALAAWGPRVALVREHLFPPRAYMAARCGRSDPSSLIVLASYLDRVVRGATGWFRRVR
jgi:Uncharacterised nucleotidyltransferase